MLIGLGSSAQAGLLDTYLVPNAINFFEDNSREAYFDANNSGFFDAGDVLVGYLRIEQRTAPSVQDTGNTLYAVFSQQVAGINASGVVSFAPTTVAGLELSSFAAGAEANALVALYSGDVGLDLTLVNPGDVSGNGTITLLDYLQAITAGTLELTAGIAAASDDQFKALVSTTLPLSTATIAGLSTTSGIASFEAMMSILTNNTSFSFADVCSTGFFAGIGGIPAGTCATLQLVTGNVLGAGNAANGEFRDGSEFGAFQQCDTDPATGTQNNTPCGFIDNADINVLPVSVPEPASMILFGFGLAALGMYGRHSRNRKKSE
jgi:hypothetical protein